MHKELFVLMVSCYYVLRDNLSHFGLFDLIHVGNTFYVFVHVFEFLYIGSVTATCIIFQLL